MNMRAVFVVAPPPPLPPVNPLMLSTAGSARDDLASLLHQTVCMA